MTRQAILGLFAIAAVVAFVFVVYVIADLGTRSRGYKVGVHFRSASGIHPSAPVYLSGVPIGAVDQIVLLPDYSTDVIIAIKRKVDIPRDATFLIQAPLTGEPSLLIVPKRTKTGEIAVTQGTLPHEVLPLDQQPQGTGSPTAADLISEGQGQIKRLDALLAQLQDATPRLLASLEETVDNANRLTVTSNASIARLADQLGALEGQLSETIAVSGGNVNALTSTLNESARASSRKIDVILAHVDAASRSIDASTASLQKISSDPRLHDDLVATAHSLAQTSQTIAQLTGDLRTITGNPQTQAQIRDAIAHLDATAQRIDSLAGAIGGRSHVAGVDVPVTGASPEPRSERNGDLRPSGIVEPQVRIEGLSAAAHGRANGTPVIGSDRGPQTDLNLVLFPRNRTSLMFGLNDIGGATSTNVAYLHSNRDVRFGGGILYSRPGALVQVDGRHFGFESRLYDLRHPTFDLYTSYRVGPQLDLFVGERDSLYPERRSVLGLQLHL